jgi:Holliday junction resolvasome RuvABC endonuclease subunit
MKVCGIDFSLTSPAMTLINDGSVAGLFCMKAKKKQAVNNSLITLFEYPLYQTELERYDKLTSLILTAIPSDITSGYLEGYAFGPSANMAFSIGECTGLLKYKFEKKFGFELKTSPPTQIKKFATGRGGAKKRDMVDEFVKTEFNIFDSFALIDDGGKDIPKPIDDLVDSYWIAKYAYHQAIT